MNSLMKTMMVAGVALLFGALGSTVQAASNSVSPGMQCWPKATNGGYYLTHYSLFLVNEGQTTVDVLCPVTRHNISNTTGTIAAWVRVRTNYNAPLACRFTAHGANGNIVASQLATTTANADVALNVDVNASAVNGHYAIQCSLPPGGRLYNYGIVEP